MNEIISTFTFVTYNLDCREYNYEERIKAFLSYVTKNPPYIVVVQEGTRLTYEKLLREMGLLGYKRQLPNVMNSRQTGEMVFSKFPISQTKYLPFQRATENRGLTLLKLDIWGREDIWLCTSQFDSNIPFQRLQIKELGSMFRDLPPKSIILFGGDTKIMEYQKDLVQPKGWSDAWYEAGSDEHKHTYDSKTNLLTAPLYHDRPDRVWYHSPNNKIICIGCKLYGHDSGITISSHYGVWTKFEFQD